MFFNNRKPDPGQIAAALAASNRSPALTLQRPSISGAESSIDSEITDIKDVPVGRYLHFSELGLSSAFALDFVIQATGPSSITLIVATDKFASHPQFELGKRLKLAKFTVTAWRRATREIIKTLHTRHAKTEDDSRRVDSDIERTAWALIDDAIQKGTSDIHIETRGSHADVYFRIHGERRVQPSMSFTTATEIANTIYNVHADASSKEISWDPDSVKDTSIEHTMPDGKKVTLRFSSGPIYPTSAKNFHLVIRLLVMEGSATKPLEKVGYTTAQIAVIEEMLIGAQGMVVLVGPTNSGKSTSMQAMIRRIYDRRGKDIKVITIEKPVEYVLSGACQMGVPEGRKSLEGEGGNIYTTYLKGTLRQDPDVVMVGEIRSADEAEAVKDLVLAGRKLVTTLHVYEALAVFARLREMGVPESILFMEGFISGVIYQRLVPILCPQCAIPVTDGLARGLIRPNTYERIIRVANLGVHDVRVRDKGGCEHCNFTGIVGRTPCAEILVPTASFLAHLRAGNEAAARAEWHANVEMNIEGWGVTAVAHAISKMTQGQLDPTDIESQIGAILIKHSSDTQSESSYRHTMPSQASEGILGSRANAQRLGMRN